MEEWAALHKDFLEAAREATDAHASVILRTIADRRKVQKEVGRRKEVGKEDRDRDRGRAAVLSNLSPRKRIEGVTPRIGLKAFVLASCS